MNIQEISKERGASIIEFGLVAFVFFLIMWGIFDFVRAFYVRNTTQHLTRCIAREAVVMKPSWTSRAKESCLMQMKGSGGYYWPFFQLVPGDMRGYFTVLYHFRPVAGTQPQPQVGPLNPSYDNQLERCADANDAGCIAYVQVYVPAGTQLEDLGLLRTWLGRTENVREPFSSTMMPAESMGYAP